MPSGQRSVLRSVMVVILLAAAVRAGADEATEVELFTSHEQSVLECEDGTRVEFGYATKQQFAGPVSCMVRLGDINGHLSVKPGGIYYCDDDTGVLVFYEPTDEPTAKAQAAEARAGQSVLATPRTAVTSTPSTRSAPTATPRTRPARAAPKTGRDCCKVCRGSKACGNSCISRQYTCRKPPGCACQG